MICPSCASVHTRVLDSRATQQWVRRRRQCEDCAHRFTTYEVDAKPQRSTTHRVSSMRRGREEAAA